MQALEVEELLDENTRLKKALIEKVKITLGGAFETISLEPFAIRGVAIVEGTWNGMYYPTELLKKLGSEKISTPLKIEHGQTEEFKGRVIGEINEWKYDDIIKGIVFNAEIWDDEIVSLIKEKALPAVSIYGMADVEYKDGKRVVTNLDLEELSLTQSPACTACWIAFSKTFINKPSHLNTSKLDNRKEGGNLMEEDVLIENLEIEESEIDEEEEVGLPNPEEKYKYDKDGKENPAKKMSIEQLEKLIKKLTDMLEKLKKEGKKYYYYPYKKDKAAEEKKVKEAEEEKPEKEVPKEEAPEEAPKKEAFRCPACPETFAEWKDFFAHWQKEHAEKYGRFEKKETSASLTENKEAPQKEEIKTKETKEVEKVTEEKPVTEAKPEVKPKVESPAETEVKPVEKVPVEIPKEPVKVEIVPEKKEVPAPAVAPIAPPVVPQEVTTIVPEAEKKTPVEEEPTDEKLVEGLTAAEVLFEEARRRKLKKVV